MNACADQFHLEISSVRRMKRRWRLTLQMFCLFLERNTRHASWLRIFTCLTVANTVVLIRANTTRWPCNASISRARVGPSFQEFANLRSLEIRSTVDRLRIPIGI